MSYWRRFLLLLVLLGSGFMASLAAEDIIELTDGRIMRGEVVEQDDDQVRMKITIGGGGEAVLGFQRERIVRMVIDGKETQLREPDPESEPEPEPEPEAEPEPEPVPLPLIQESNLWKNLKAGNKQHIIIYGTSLVTNRHTRIPKTLQSTLDKEVGDGIAKVSERAQAGKYSKWALENLHSRVIKDKPDAVIMEFASNDSVERIKQSVPEARKNWVAMLDKLREEAPDTEVFLYITAPPWDAASSGRKAHALRRQGVENYFQMVRELSVEYQTYVIDTYWEFLDRKDPPGHKEYKKYIGDGHHPAGRGRSEIIIPMMLQAFAHGSCDTLGKPGIHRWPRVQGN